MVLIKGYAFKVIALAVCGICLRMPTEQIIAVREAMNQNYEKDACVLSAEFGAQKLLASGQ